MSLISVKNLTFKYEGSLDNVFETNILLGNIRLALSVDSITTCLPVIKSIYKNTDSYLISKQKTLYLIIFLI